MERSGMIVGTFESSHKRKPVWAWLEVYFTKKRYRSKRNRLDHQPLFKNGAQPIDHCRNVRRLEGSMVVFRLYKNKDF